MRQLQEHARRSRRKGMSLVEIIAALTILTGAMLGLGIFGHRFTRTMTETRQRSTALDLAVDRLEEVKSAATYVSIDAFAGTESAPNGLRNFVRRTYVQRTGGLPNSVVDYRTVTVVVTAPAIDVPVTKTTIIANF